MIFLFLTPAKKRNGDKRKVKPSCVAGVRI